MEDAVGENTMKAFRKSLPGKLLKKLATKDGSDPEMLEHQRKVYPSDSNILLAAS